MLHLWIPGRAPLARNDGFNDLTLCSPRHVTITSNFSSPSFALQQAQGYGGLAFLSAIAHRAEAEGTSNLITAYLRDSRI